MLLDYNLGVLGQEILVLNRHFEASERPLGG